MTIPSGKKLGRYEIRAKIGEGGMGEVYLAQDIKLNRKVALKILSAEAAAHQERMRRFVQEAKTASALNHPNILTIYEIDESPSGHFIVTEFIDGITLRDHLRRAPMKLAEVLELGTQLASALAAAHSAGIVHRDVKPANIMVRRDGIIKILDFGIAKLVQADTPSMDTDVATLPLVQTEPGRVIGTFAYMSPEQVRGLELDARTDIWSLGIVLYEMAAGCSPFTGETLSHVGVSILEKSPPPLSKYVPNVPGELQRIVRKALAKDRDERYQTARDLSIDLKNLRRDLELQGELERSLASGAGASAAITASEPDTSNYPIHDATVQRSSATVPSGRKPFASRRTIMIGVVGSGALIVLALAAVFGIRGLKRSAPSAFERIEITQLTTSRNLRQVAISPDGKYIAYALSNSENEGLWLRQANDTNDLQIVAPALVSYEGVTFARDSTSLYYVTRDANGVSTLNRVQVLGGTPQKLISNVDSPVTFSPDGKHLAFVRGKFPTPDQSALLIADSDGSHERTLASRRAPQFFYPISNWTGPSWSPDGELIACAVADLTNGREGNVFTFAVKDGKEKQVMAKNFAEVGRVEWLADMNGLVIVGTELFTGTFPGQVWYVSYPDGTARRITNDFGNYRALSMTSDGHKLVTISFTDLYGIWTAPEGNASRARQISPVSRRGGLSWTPDGRIVYATTMSGHSDIWIMNADGNGRQQLTSNVEQNLEPSVSPDGRHISFFSTREGRADLWLIDIDGGNPRRLTKGLLTWQSSWSPDGKWILFVTYPEWKIWKVGLDGGPPVPVTDRPAYRPMVSPDGKSLACYYSNSDAAASTETVYNLAILPLDGGAPKTLPLRGRLDPSYALLQWSADGRAILYNTINNNVVNIWSQPVDGGQPKPVTDFKDSSITSFSWSRDQRWLACVRGTITSDAVLIEIK